MKNKTEIRPWRLEEEENHFQPSEKFRNLGTNNFAQNQRFA